MCPTKMKAIKTYRYFTLLLLTLAAFTLAACSSDDDEGGLQQGGPNTNANVATTDQAVLRLEFPRLKGGDSKVIVYRTASSKYDKDRVNYAVEWDCGKKSQRWSCYQLHQGYTGSYSRVIDSYPYDTENLSRDDYVEVDYINKAGYEHGHICPSADRKYSYDANYQTFYMTNMQPQYHKFNNHNNTGSDQGEGLWYRMECKVRDWVPRKQTDTLYVCKGGTIDNEDQIIERFQGKLIVPRYFFMAILLKNEMGYRGVGFWAEQKRNEWRDDEPLSNYAVSIDELERLTGIDFFCNLPDNIENSVEDHYVPTVWGL